MGKVGQASMRPAPKRNAVRELLVGKQDLKQAAEVILGRLDIADLIGGSNVQYKAAEVCLAALSWLMVSTQKNACRAVRRHFYKPSQRGKTYPQGGGFLYHCWQVMLFPLLSLVFQSSKPCGADHAVGLQRCTCHIYCMLFGQCTMWFCQLNLASLVV